MKKNIAFLAMMLALALLSGCSQMENMPAEDTPQEIHTQSEPETTVGPVTTSEPEPTPEPTLEPEPEVFSLPQPQADGTGLSFEFPDDWKEYPADALRDLQIGTDYLGNRILYGVLHGFMESQEISAISLADSSADDYEYVVYYYPSYDVSLADGTPLRLKFAITRWRSEEGGEDEIYCNSVDVYPAFGDCHWSLELGYGYEYLEGGDDWVYERVWGNPTRYYIISEDSLHNYTPPDDHDDDYEDPVATDPPAEPSRLTQCEWPDYCDEIDCLMMESVGLRYNKNTMTASMLLRSGRLIVITVIPKIGGGVEYGANVKVDGFPRTVSVKSSDGIHYQCRIYNEYHGMWVTLTKDGWTNWY